MNWSEARLKLADGKKVRRPHWVTRLYQSHGKILWDISERLARQCNYNHGPDRTYKPTKIDVDADDWRVA